MSAAPLRVVCVGAHGRMGRFVADLLRREPGFLVVAELGREHRLANALAECGADVGLDFTAAGSGFEHGRLMLERGIRPVIGTSGVSRSETAELDALARSRDLGGLVVPNFSLGMVLLQAAAESIARRFPSIEIIELHHDGKKDAPSGTARDTAERLRAARGEERGDVPIHSIRLPGLYAHQEILFGAAGESVTLRHDMSSPLAFGPGILAALRFAADALGVHHGLAAALHEGPRQAR